MVVGPVTGGQASMALRLSGRVDALELLIWTKSEVLVRREHRDGGFGPGWITVQVDVAGLSNGLYYSSANGRMGKWMLLR